MTIPRLPTISPHRWRWPATAGALAALLLLSSCGGGGSATPPPVVQPPAAAPLAWDGAAATWDNVTWQ